MALLTIIFLILFIITFVIFGGACGLLFWIAAGEPDTNGDLERDSGHYPSES